MTKSKTPVVSLCVSGFIGANEAQRAIARVSRRIQHFVLTEPRVNGPEARFLVAHMRQLRPRTLIVGGWSRHYEPFLALAKRGTDIAVYWTSTGAQTEIGGEIRSFEALLADPRVTHMLCVDRALAESALRRGKSTMYLPVPGGETVGIRPRQAANRESVLSLFCSPHEVARKNILNTLLAVASLKRRCVLHLNGLSGHPVYRSLLERLGIVFRDFGWMGRQQYEEALSRVDLGLQASFVESFGQVAVDHLARGIPVVAAASLPALRETPRPVAARFLVAHPDDWREIRDAIEYWLENPQRARRALASLRRPLARDAAKRRRAIDHVLRRLS